MVAAAGPTDRLAIEGGAAARARAAAVIGPAPLGPTGTPIEPICRTSTTEAAVAAAAREATSTAATTNATAATATATATPPPAAAATGDQVWTCHGSSVLSGSQGRPRGHRRHGQHTGHDKTKLGEPLHGFTRAQASS